MGIDIRTLFSALLSGALIFLSFPKFGAGIPAWVAFVPLFYALQGKRVMQGMAVGRDHIASTVYTLAFAYVGTALPILMAASLMQRSFVDLLQVSQVTEEIARTLPASVG